MAAGLNTVEEIGCRRSESLFGGRRHHRHLLDILERIDGFGRKVIGTAARKGQ